MYAMFKTAQIFLCYAKEDKPQIEELYNRLKQAGFAPWMDKVDLIGGEEWRPTIQNAIKQAHFFLACVSRHWVPTNPDDRKRFFRREIQTALDVLPELPPGGIFIIPVRLEECEVPESLSLFQWINLFEPEGWNRLLKAIHKGMDQLGIIKPIRLRATPINGLSRGDAEQMIRKYNFADLYLNRFGKGLRHQYEVIERNGDTAVIDNTTGLKWQLDGLMMHMDIVEAQRYVQDLNQEAFAGYSDWRLPTLEEAMSLMEPEMINDESHIGSVFSRGPAIIWTIDKRSVTRVWHVNFYSGCCDISHIHNDSHGVRAVRSNYLTI